MLQVRNPRQSRRRSALPGYRGPQSRVRLLLRRCYCGWLTDSDAERRDPRWEKARLAQALEEARKAKAVRRGIDPVKQPEAFSKVKLTMAEEADVEAGVQTKDVHAETSAMLADNWKDDDDDDY